MNTLSPKNFPGKVLTGGLVVCVVAIILYLVNNYSDIVVDVEPPPPPPPPTSVIDQSMGGSSSKMARPIIIPPSAAHTATVIFLHGLGDTGHGWAPALQSIKQPHIKYICPTAPAIPVTLNGGMRMPSWFDIYALSEGPEDEAGIKSATEQIHNLVKEETAAGIPSNRILLGGFSQGGALALYSALTQTQPLAGIVALSSWLPMGKQFTQFVKTTQKDLPIFQGHGDMDPLVSFKWGQMTHQLLSSYFSSTNFTTYSGLSHSASDKELQDVKEFISKCLP